MRWRGFSKLTLALALAACGESSAREASVRPTEGVGGAAPAPARQYIVGIDISGSRTPTQLRDARALMESLIASLSYGDRLVLIETYQGGRDDAERWEVSLPASSDPSNPTISEREGAEEARAAALAVLPTFFDPRRMKEIRSTDLIQTLYRASDYARGRSRDSTVVLLLSDMLNATPELNMEKPGGVPDVSWVQARSRAGRLPALRGVCVFVVGADVETPRGVAARRLWMEYLGAAGARMDADGYRGLVTRREEVRC